MLCEGTGEANRAIEAALGTGLPAVRPRNDPGEEDIGTGRGLEEDSPFPGVDMVRERPVLEKYSSREVVALSHDYPLPKKEVQLLRQVKSASVWKCCLRAQAGH